MMNNLGEHSVNATVIKPGVKTTEFWVHNVLQALTIAATGAGVLHMQIGGAISAILGIVYIAARTVVKFGAANGFSATGGGGPRPPCATLETPDAAAKAGDASRAVASGSAGEASDGGAEKIFVTAAAGRVLALASVGLVTLALAGCARNLYARWAQANDAYDAALVSLHQLRTHDAISRTREADVAAYMPAAEAALNAALADAKAKNASAQKQDLAAFNAALTHIQAGN